MEPARRRSKLAPERPRPDGTPSPLASAGARADLRQRRRIRLLPALAQPWISLLERHRWDFPELGDAVDVVVHAGPVPSGAPDAVESAAIIHVVAAGQTWAGEGADIVLYEPTPEEFLAACDRALQLARARRGSGELITEVLECIPEAFFVLDWDRRVVYQNRASREFVARGEGGDGDVLGELICEHVPRSLRDIFQDTVIAVLRNGVPHHFDLQLVDDARWIEMNAYFIPSGAVISLRDVTAQRRAPMSPTARDKAVPL